MFTEEEDRGGSAKDGKQPLEPGTIIRLMLVCDLFRGKSHLSTLQCNINRPAAFKLGAIQVSVRCKPRRASCVLLVQVGWSPRVSTLLWRAIESHRVGNSRVRLKEDA